jgi:putative hydrolase of the HAD superfamily
LREIDPALVRDVDLLCLDAGNTVVFLDHPRLAATCAGHGFATSAQTLVRAEGRAKIALENGEVLDVGWSNDVVGARSWGLVVGTMLNVAGLAVEAVPPLLDALWREHRRHNFWSLVPSGLREALSRMRGRGVPVAVVSNSEGTLERVLDELRVLDAFDLVVDSGLVGFEKPDPRIFRIALDRFSVAADRALHVGDTYATDVLGARGAGLRVALVDPHGHFTGRHADVARVPGATEVADAIATLRSS